MFTNNKTTINCEIVIQWDPIEQWGEKQTLQPYASTSINLKNKQVTREYIHNDYILYVQKQAKLNLLFEDIITQGKLFKQRRIRMVVTSEGYCFIS